MSAQKSGNAISIQLTFLVSLILAGLSSAFGEEGEARVIAKALDQGTENHAAQNELMRGIPSVEAPFMENLGQFDEQVAFCVNTFGGPVFITQQGEIVYALGDGTETRNGCVLKETIIHGKEATVHGRSTAMPDSGMRVVDITGEQPCDVRISSFCGDDPSRWQSRIPSYRFLDMGEVIDGVKVKLRASGRSVEKIFTLAPHVGPGCVRLSVEGAIGLGIDDDGLLNVETNAGSVLFSRPVAFQEKDGQRVELEAKYVLDESCPNQYGFEVIGYDPELELVIDPLLASTFLGGREWDGYEFGCIRFDDDGYVYVTGRTSSPDFPTTPAGYDRIFNGGFEHIGDVFISKFDHKLTTLLASTYLGGDSQDYSTDLVFDGNGHLYVAGFTESFDFPTTPTAFDTTHNGGLPGGYESDVFVSKLDTGLTTLVASTFLGGSSYDGTWETKLLHTGTGGIYVGGGTTSSDFPLSPGAYDKYFNGWSDVFITLFDSNLTTLQASTFVGSNGWDECDGMLFDKDGNIVFAGGAGGSNFPTTHRAYQEDFNGYGDGFVAKITPDLRNLVASTYIGGTSGDECYSLAMDKKGSIYVGGETASSDFPTTPNAYDQDYNGGIGDVFIARFSHDLTELEASTYLGGYDWDSFLNAEIALAKKDTIYITGGTWSPSFPVTPKAFSMEQNGKWDVFVSRLDRDLTTLQVSTFIGGNKEDLAQGIVINEKGNVYISGETSSFNYPVKPGSYCTTYQYGTCDVFITIIDSELCRIETNPMLPEPVGSIYPIDD